MRAKARRFLTIILPAITIIAFAMLVMFENASYAKGATKSGKSSSGSSSSAQSKGSSKESSKGSSKESSKGSSSSKPSNSGSTSRSTSGGSSNSGSSNSRSSNSSYRPAAPSRPDSSPERSSPSDSVRSAPSLKGRVESRSPVLRTEERSTRTEVVRPTPGRTAYRKEYADIGKVWSSRHERRGTYADRQRFRERVGDDHRWVYPYYGYRSVYSSPLYHYQHYCFDYWPDYSWPGIYCYYYGAFPPYVCSSRIVVVPTFVTRRLFIRIPIVIDWHDDYYLTDTSGREFRQALTDIRRAWERGDVDFIMDHVRPGSSIAVYLQGDYAYSVNSAEYYDMTRDAITAIRTRTFVFDRWSRRDHDCIVAFGTHNYVSEDDGYVKTIYVSYTLERFGGEWYITEVGSSPSRLW